jgi:hypothetical protein
LTTSWLEVRVRGLHPIPRHQAHHDGEMAAVDMPIASRPESPLGLTFGPSRRS